MMKFSASFLAALLSSIWLYAGSSPVRASTGGEESPPEFNSPWGPVRPLNDLLAGSLGVVEASWWRKPLLLAWYRFNGLDIPSGAADTFSYTTDPIDYGRVVSADPSSVVVGKSSTPELSLGAITPHATLPGGNAWDQFENCPGDSLEQATRTLAQRRKLWGDTSPALRDWLTAQKRVFARCPLGPAYFRSDLRGGRQVDPEYAKRFLLPDMSLRDPPADAPLLLVKDRAYQRASALFYEGHYPEAASDFVNIARDKASPWSEWGMYLAFRARLREVQISTPAGLYEDCGTPECVRQRADMQARRQAEAAKLRADVAQALTLARKHGDAAEIRRLQDIDALIGARLDPSAQFRKLADQLTRQGIAGPEFRRAASDYLHLHRQFPPSEPLGEWLSGLIDGYDPTGAVCAVAPSSAKVDRHSLTPEQIRCLRRQWSEQSLKRFQKQPTQYAWLFSAAALAERDDLHLEPLLKMLAAVPDNHVGATSFMLHRLRLGARDEGLTLAAALIKRPDVQSDYSARNRVGEYRLWHAESLQEFWADGLREIGTAFDRDTLLKSAPPNPTDAPQLGWDYDARWVLNYELPHAALLETARRSGWPEEHRRTVANMAWSRAVLRRDAAAAREALFVVADINQKQPLPTIERLRAIKDEKTFLIESGLLADSAVINGDCHLAVPKVDEYTPAYAGSAGDFKRHFGRFAKLLLLPDMHTDWQHEHLALAALPDLDSAWMQNVIDFANTFPEDARAPILLRKAVYRTRMNWCAEPSAGKLSKAAFDLLKRNYPKSKEALTTKYWFKPRT